MFNPVDTPQVGTRKLLCAAVLAGLLPIGALAGITGGSAADAAKAPAVSAATSSGDRSAKAPAGTYQIRCWQQGRLLFEENQVSLPADSAKYGVKMTGTDRHGKPMYVADTTNATCLIRSVDDGAAR
jgi:hypothetical protein